MSPEPRSLKLTSVFSLILLSGAAFGASETLSGVVRDLGSNKAETGISGVKITLKDPKAGDGIPTLTNAKGQFTIGYAKERKNAWVQFTKVGYQPHPKTQSVESLQSQQGAVYLVREHVSKSYLRSVARNVVTGFSDFDEAKRTEVAKVVASLSAENRAVVTAELERTDSKDMIAAIHGATDDAIVTARVRAALFSDLDTPVRYINVDTFKGTVQLSGFVDSTGAKDSVAEAALGVEGVKDVKNDLQLRSEM